MDVINIIVSLLIIAGITVTIFAKRNEYRKYHYICPKCSKSYKPKTLMESMWAVYANNEKELKCPYCGNKCWVKMIKDPIE